MNAKIGAGGQKGIMNRQEWCDLFNASGLPAKEGRAWIRRAAP